MVALLPDVIEIAMKSATFLGVLACAIPLVVMRGGSARLLGVGAAGVALMVVNAWTGPWGLVVDAAYLLVAARAGWRALAAAGPAPRTTTFTVIAAR